MSSDNESLSGSSSDEDLATTGLIATRERRSTAGNRIADLLANLDDEELQKELLGDEEDDAEDYEGSNKSDEDEQLESSSSEDEDVINAEDEEGEKELKRAERVEAKRKRKAGDARLKLPAALKKRGAKRVKVAEDGEEKDGEDVAMGEAGEVQAAPARPKKKSERVSWLPTAEDAPTRQSRRAAAVINREATMANLEEQAKRSEKQKSFMRDAAVREKSTRRMQLSQEQRLEKMRRIEKETARDLGRFEREEAERVRLREEALAAKRKRGVDGPVLRTWSGSAVWEGGKVTGNWKMKVKRVQGGSKMIEEIDEMVAPKKKDAKTDTEAQEEAGSMGMRKMSDAIDATRTEQDDGQANASKPAGVLGGQTPATQNSPSVSSFAGASTQPQSMNGTPPKPKSISDSTQAADGSSVSWLHGIQEYASQPMPPSQTVPPQPPLHNPLQPQQQPAAPYTPSAPSLNAAALQPPTSTLAHPAYAPLATAVPTTQQQPSKPLHQTSMYPTWPPGQGAFSIHQAPTNPSLTPLTPALPPPPPEPLIREQALRTLLILEAFPSLPDSNPDKSTTTTTSRRTSAKTPLSTNPLDPTPLATTLLGTDPYPALTPAQRNYLSTRHRTSKKEPLMPPAPPHLMCAVQHTVKAKYRDGKTGLGFGDLHAYKGLQRVLAGGTMWSSLLGCWVGPSYGAMGRPARGVPEGFAGPIPGRKETKKTKEKDEDVKMEGAA